MNFQLVLLTLCQGLFLTNNVAFIVAINGLVGLSLAPAPWMATLLIMGYVAQGWTWLNLGAVLPVIAIASAVGWLSLHRCRVARQATA